MAKRVKGTSAHTADTGAVPGTKGFAGIPRCVVESPAYRHLQLIDRAILVEIVNRMKGDNNGSIHISYAEIASALNRKNQAPIGPAIARLMQHGLLDISEESVWKERKAREYRLTFVNTTDSIGRPIKATNDYVTWRPEEKNDATNVVAAKRKTATTFVAGKFATATDAVAASTENCGKCDPLAATNGVVPILKPYTGWKNSEGNDPQIASGPSEPLNGSAAEAAMRDKITDHWSKLDRQARTAWASGSGLSL